MKDVKIPPIMGAAIRLITSAPAPVDHMTVAVMFMGLVPIMWSTGAGADTMRRIAAPMIGGIFTSFILELVVYPAIYEVWKWNSEVKKLAAS